MRNTRPTARLTWIPSPAWRPTHRERLARRIPFQSCLVVHSVCEATAGGVKMLIVVTDLSLFPKELWSTLEGTDGDAVRAHLDLAAEKQRRVGFFIMLHLQY